MTQLTDKVFAITMPKGAESCEIRGAHPGRPYPLLSFYGEGEAVILPAGEYQILVFNTATATEEDARKVVGEAPWVNYMPQNLLDRDHKCWLGTADECLRSLLRSKGLDDKNNYALIEKENSDE